jgi:Mrp family chromosome partitioning ATPase/capsular polysaccharide biosynthesis protein
MTAPDGVWAEEDAAREGPGILSSLWRYRRIVAAATLLAALAGYGAARLQPARYEAQAAMILRDPGSPGVLGGDSSQSVDLDVYMARQASTATSRMVLERAAGNLDPRLSVAELRDAVQVAPSGDLASLVISARAGDREQAADIANAVGDAYQQVNAESVARQAQRAIASIGEIRTRLQAELDAVRSGATAVVRQQALTQQIANLQEREQDIAARAAVYGSGVELFERADPPGSPAQPKPVLTAVLSALVGLLAAGAWAWWAAARHGRAEHREDPGAVVGVPLLGEVPEFRAGRLEPAVVESYHFVVASLEHQLSNLGGRSVALTSAAPGDGKTSTALGIAIAARQQHRRVLLVDTDERTRRLSELCREGEALGLIQVSDEPVERLDLSDDGIVLQTLLDGSDSGHPVGALRTPAFRKFLLAAEERADLVLIDTPALLGVSEALAIANQVDAVILVVARGTPLDRLRAARDRLGFTGTPVIGYVFNRSTTSPAPYVKAYRRRAAARIGQGGDG